MKTVYKGSLLIYDMAPEEAGDDENRHTVGRQRENELEKRKTVELTTDDRSLTDGASWCRRRVHQFEPNRYWSAIMSPTFVPARLTSGIFHTDSTVGEFNVLPNQRDPERHTKTAFHDRDIKIGRWMTY
jgi:hypothetical protein